MDHFEQVCRWRARALDRTSWLRSAPPLLARYVLGVAFAGSGWAKLHALGTVSAYFASLGIPAAGFNAGLVAVIELFFGGLLLLGLATRAATVPLIGVMGVALITAKSATLGHLSGVVGSIEVAYLALLFYLLVTGPGALAADSWIAYRFERVSRPRTPTFESPGSGVSTATSS